MENQEIKVDQTESIKLIKNSRGYAWEIRLLELNIDRLEQLNKEMNLRFNNEKEVKENGEHDNN